MYGGQQIEFWLHLEFQKQQDVCLLALPFLEGEHWLGLVDWVGVCFLTPPEQSSLVEGTVSLGSKTSCVPWLHNICRADLVFPSNIRFAKDLASRGSSLRGLLYLGSRCCKVLPSLTRASKSPSFQCFMRRSIHEM